MTPPSHKGLASATGSSQIGFDFQNAQDGIHPLPFHADSAEKPFECKTRYEELMSVPALMTTFWSKFSKSAGKGIDRVNGYQFGSNRLADLTHASRKCLEGTLRFTPYLEVLRPKGRDSNPRLISIPTVRDRVVLHQLKDLLAEAFPECVPRSIAGSIVRQITADLPSHDLETTYVAGCDIKKFCDTLHRDRLMKHLGRRITDPRALELIHHSIITPTVPASAHRHDYASKRAKEGVPQGLATSNIMAAIYISEIDDAMRQFPIRYYRYVDDVLIYGPHEEVLKAQKSFIDRARRRGLSVHKVGGGKSHITKLSGEFRYLGYVFKARSVSVRPGSVENLLQSLAAKFSDFKHNSARRLERYKYLTPERLNEIFLLELNERITGAIQEDRRYGWIAYFSQITDLSLLHKLDSVLHGMFRRLPQFGHKTPGGLKSFSMIERPMWERDHPFTPVQRVEIRQQRSAPIMRDLHAWLEALAPKVLPESRIGKAVYYTLGQWQKLCVFLTHGEAPMTNNRVENAIRPFVAERSLCTSLSSV
jgi:RNA-directed DNA polymerase